MAAGFTGHGMPRILLSTADLVPKVLDYLKVAQKTPSIIANVPALPKPYALTRERLDGLKSLSREKYLQDDIDANLLSAKKAFMQPKPPQAGVDVAVAESFSV
jgi:hypothetical protein